MDTPWQYSTVHNSACRVIEEQTLWGQAVCRVWLPSQDAVVRVPRTDLQPLDPYPLPLAPHQIAYVAAAAKVAEVLEGSTSATDGHVLLAPMESDVIPLPHQIHALSRAISGDRVRYLLADEVGLGKTIEEGILFLPTARHIWDALQTAEAEVQATLGQDESITAHERLQEAAEQAGQELFDTLQQAHKASVRREEERGMVAFNSRRKAIARVGLPEVRQFRLSRFDADESEWRHELQSARQTVPEIRSLLMLRIIKGGAQ
jgi:hypothetical protein